ncbi:uncharacterized protein (DUF302 family) [Hoeflea marina]|uniref:Uncharacterized protein (DUF302 family) n=1 Tax=Hoeflea marina TaxID=274592 RepID=A0A317PLU3_9HYPH|nr:DUF302 domain-containing protein [Hoeflea marina]PWW01717.1 uncharacterized protein (DUF302 family) [Hoeflea marina]
MLRLASTVCLALGLIGAAAGAAFAGGQSTSYVFDGSFEDAAFGVENAIVNKGLVVDHVSHVGDMLSRTGEDLGSDVELFKAASIYLFCSARLSRQVMEADPGNIANCPYGVFVTDRDGRVEIGYRNMPEPSMAPVAELLDSIAREAAGQ